MRLPCSRPVEVRGRQIGGTAPLICLPLVAAQTSDLLCQADALLPLCPDLLEWRIDSDDHVDNIAACVKTLQSLRAIIGNIPLIFTCRIDTEGGFRRLSRNHRLNLIQKAIASGLVDIVDFELCNDNPFIRNVIDAAAAHSVKLIGSFHDFEKTPDEADLLEKLALAQRIGADIAKAAVMPSNYRDVLVLLSATLKARETLEIPIVTMAMAQPGVVTRIAGGLFGSDITFAAGKQVSAPGQIPIGALRQAMALLYP
jgi:3-dehydroquinate dehydratase-1